MAGERRVADGLDQIRFNRPFRSLTARSKGLKPPVSEFHPMLHQNSRCPFSRLSCTVDSQRVEPRLSQIGASGPSGQVGTAALQAAIVYMVARGGMEPQTRGFSGGPESTRVQPKKP